MTTFTGSTQGNYDKIAIDVNEFNVAAVFAQSRSESLVPGPPQFS